MNFNTRLVPHRYSI